MTGAFRIKLAAYIAIGTGALLAIVETLLNWGNWQWWPWYVIDYVSALMLLFGGFMCRKDASSLHARALLAAGWGFTFAMSWSSLAGNIERAQESLELERHARAGGLDTYLVLVGLLVFTSVVGLLLSISPTNESNA